MGIEGENPISIKKVRSAVEERAGQFAKKDFSRKAQEVHVQQAFKELREKREYAESLYEYFIERLAAKKAMKDEMGPDLEYTYSAVVENITKKYEKEVLAGARKIATEIKEAEEGLKAIGKLLTEMTKIMIEEIKSDPHIQDGFKEKSELLEKALAQTSWEIKESLLKLMGDNDRSFSLAL